MTAVVCDLCVRPVPYVDSNRLCMDCRGFVYRRQVVATVQNGTNAMWQAAYRSGERDADSGRPATSTYADLDLRNAYDLGFANGTRLRSDRMRQIREYSQNKQKHPHQHQHDLRRSPRE